MYFNYFASEEYMADVHANSNTLYIYIGRGCSAILSFVVAAEKQS